MGNHGADRAEHARQAPRARRRNQAAAPAAAAPPAAAPAASAPAAAPVGAGAAASVAETDISLRGGGTTDPRLGPLATFAMLTPADAQYIALDELDDPYQPLDTVGDHALCLNLDSVSALPPPPKRIDRCGRDLATLAAPMPQPM